MYRFSLHSGLFIGIELVADKASKAGFANALGLHRQLKRTTLDNGLICYSMGGSIDGQSGDHVLLAPPFIIQDAHIDELVEKLDKSLVKVMLETNKSR